MSNKKISPWYLHIVAIIGDETRIKGDIFLNESFQGDSDLSDVEKNYILSFYLFYLILIHILFRKQRKREKFSEHEEHTYAFQLNDN